MLEKDRFLLYPGLKNFQFTFKMETEKFNKNKSATNRYDYRQTARHIGGNVIPTTKRLWRHDEKIDIHECFSVTMHFYCFYYFSGVPFYVYCIFVECFRCIWLDVFTENLSTVNLPGNTSHEIALGVAETGP